MPGEPLVRLLGIGVVLGGETVLDGVDLSVAAGQVVSIVGPNGAGKSTLLKIVLGLLKPDRGTVERDAGLRIGYLPQRFRPEPSLPLSVRRFVGLARAGARRGEVDEALARVQVAHLAGRQIHDLSGGETQRALLARALLRRPHLLVLDEPGSGVDIAGQSELYELIGSLARDHGCGVLMVSHDLHLVMSATDEVICLNRHICCSGHPHAVSQDPAYADMFGGRIAGALAVYTHHHDHTHDGHCHVVALPPSDPEPKSHSHG